MIYYASRWKTKIDADETIVVIMNVLEKNPDLPNRLIVIIIGSTADSDKKRSGISSKKWESTSRHPGNISNQTRGRIGVNPLIISSGCNPVWLRVTDVTIVSDPVVRSPSFEEGAGNPAHHLNGRCIPS
jgi:hypothetical protein